MKRLETIKWGSLVLAEIGIVAFWISGFNDRLDISAVSLAVAGIFGYVFLACLGLQKLRSRNGFC